MDKYNVISITNNLSELQNDMIQWSNMPYEFRQRSDEDCIRLYGMTNTDLYNRLRAVLVSTQKPIEDIDVIGNGISESSLDANGINMDIGPNDFSEEKDTMKLKKEIATELDKSPLIVIISPFEDKEKQEYDIEYLDRQIQKYNLLNDKNKLLSDSYSMSIWGYDVQNMYYIMKRILLNRYNKDIIEFDLKNRVQILDKGDNPIEPVIQNMQEKVLKEDTLGLLSIKLDESFIKNPVQRAIYENKIIPMINETLYENDFNMPKVVPWFTLSEMNEMRITLDGVDPNQYYFALAVAMNQYKQGVIKEKDILSLGWNPSVELSEKSITFARQRQIHWFNEYGCKIVDVSKWNLDSALLESSTGMNNVYKQKNLHPIYIVLSFSNTLFGKVINKAKHSTYSHAGISLDSDLKNIYTFKFEKGTNGFGIESLDNYLANYSDAVISVMALFVDKSTKDKLNRILVHFEEIKDKTSYGFSNLFNFVINRSVENFKSLSMVCSQFVDTVLKLVNIDLNGKSSNLITPQDFVSIARPKVFKVYEGLVKEYTDKKVESIILRIFSLTSDNNVRYSNVVEAVSGLVLDTSHITLNESAIQVLDEINMLMTPVAVIQEKKAPFEINEKGDLVINFIKPLEQQYQEAHRLLLLYGEYNIEGTKHELARLFYVNYRIEKKVKKMYKEDKNYKRLIDLRARVLNDFTKYFKIVLKKESNFDFTEYYKNTEYYDGNIVIDNKIVNATAKMIEAFLRMLGLIK